MCAFCCIAYEFSTCTCSPLSLLILCSLSTLLSIDSAEQLVQMSAMEFLLPNDCKLCISGILFLDGGSYGLLPRNLIPRGYELHKLKSLLTPLKLVR